MLRGGSPLSSTIARTALLLARTLAITALRLFFAKAPALADYGPHDATINSGSAGLTADTCAACHRAHAAQGPNLIGAPSGVALCLTCHGSGRAGSTTNVSDGVQAGTSRGLKGSGFVTALMDTAWDGNAVARPATSMHLFDGTNVGTMWGNGAIGSGPGKTSVSLTCASCHNPHGNGSNRVLRPIPTDSAAASGIAVIVETAKVYVVASALNRYFGEVYGGGNYLKQYQLDIGAPSVTPGTKGGSVRELPRGAWIAGPDGDAVRRRGVARRRDVAVR